MRHARALDLYEDDLALRGKSPRTRSSYRWQLEQYADFIDPHGERDVRADTEEDCRRFLGRWRNAKPATLAQRVSILRGYFAFLERHGHIDRGCSPMREIDRPPRTRPEYLDVVTTAGSDVTRLIEACRDWQELICLGAAAYLGRRRTALAEARRGDLDLERGFVRFLDKNRKVIDQPVPDEFLAVLRAAEAAGVWDGPEDYLIPNRRKLTTNPKGRSSKIVYETVKKVAKRARVRTHVHALRAAFAVQFLETHPGEIEVVKELLAHDRIETTMVYLRRMNRARAMESVRDLKWSANGSVLSPRAVEAHTGFEPVLGEDPVDSPLKAKLDELIAQDKARARARRR